jgi:serine phosphatase RsbU (regulator of sigma subunit)
MLVDSHSLSPAATGLAELHACRTREELDTMVGLALWRLLPGVDLALCVADEDPALRRVAFANGLGCPLRTGTVVTTDAWPVADQRCMPVGRREQRFGELLLGADPDTEQQPALAALLCHYGTALWCLTMNQEARQATDNYCASLQAFEEGIILFQEADPAAITARILALVAGVVQATAGALYSLRQVGDPASGLVLEQHLGVPEALLAGLRGKGDVAWPDGLLELPAHVWEREADDSIALLAPDCVPSILNRVVAVPLSYHGVVAGVCVLLNPMVTERQVREHLGRLQSIGQLAAAVLHRLQLEQQTARSRSIARELEIAETLQRRSLPAVAPTSDRYDFAWSLVAAQHIGGDYLDLLAAANGEIHAVVADASGHGINSALLMSSYRANYRATASQQSPTELARALNREVVNEVGPTGMFITGALVRFNQDGRVSLCSAGHCPAMVYRAAAQQVEFLPTDGPPFGFTADAEYTSQDHQLLPGDVMLLYTDGLTEATDSELEMFSEERLAELLRAKAACDPQAILAAAQQAVAKFTGRENFDDDVSLLVIKFR